jgi:hypothetical protein
VEKTLENSLEFQGIPWSHKELLIHTIVLYNVATAWIRLS